MSPIFILVFCLIVTETYAEPSIHVKEKLVKPITVEAPPLPQQTPEFEGREPPLRGQGQGNTQDQDGATQGQVQDLEDLLEAQVEDVLDQAEGQDVIQGQLEGQAQVEGPLDQAEGQDLIQGLLEGQAQVEGLLDQAEGQDVIQGPFEAQAQVEGHPDEEDGQDATIQGQRQVGGHDFIPHGHPDQEEGQNLAAEGHLDTGQGQEGQDDAEQGQDAPELPVPADELPVQTVESSAESVVESHSSVAIISSELNYTAVSKPEPEPELQPQPEPEAEPEAKPLYGTRPNIILIVADDMGYGDVGAFWDDALKDSPNLNRLAENGIKFTDFHAAVSKCTPSRAAFLTSRLGLRTGVVTNFDIHALGGLPTNETTVADTLRAAGYTTSMIGKWHLGQRPQFLPTSHGFDSYLGLPYSNDMGCVYRQGDDLPPCPPCPRIKTRYDYMDKPARCYLNHALPLMTGNDVLEQPPDLYTLSDMFTDHMKELVHKKDRPFFLYFAAFQPHVPLTPSARAVLAAEHTESSYRQTVMELDLLVGDVVKAVEDAGIANNTLIWFTSDNGPWAARCQFGGSVGPFTARWQHRQGGGSGAKGTVWEAGHRVPSIAYWPGVIPAGVTSKELTSALDFYPTFANLAGIELPDDRRYDGLDISNLLLGKQSNLVRALFHPNSGNFGPDGHIGAVRLGKYKGVYFTGNYFNTVRLFIEG